MHFNHTSLVRDHTSATEILKEDLPTNPLSHLIVSISGLNATDEATLAEILAFLNTLSVSDQGKTIVSVQSEDLYALNCYILKRRPILTNRIATDNASRCLTLIVPFGRKLFDPSECYPSKKKGDVTLRCDMTALATSIDNGVVNIDCVTLPGASPSHWMKSRTLTVTAPGATGENEIALPTGNELIALLLRQTTIPTTTSQVTGIEAVKLLVSESEHSYSAATKEALTGAMAIRLDGQSGTIAAAGAELPAATMWMDFDPTEDGAYLINTEGASSVKLVADMGVDEASYITVLERVPVR